MLYEVLILAFLLLIFCYFTMIFVIKTMISVLNSARPEGTSEIKAADIVKMPKKKSKLQKEIEEAAAKERRQWETIMRNLDAYDGTGIGQEEVR